MILHEMTEAIKCYIGTIKNAGPECFECKKKTFCDDITRVILAHKTKMKVEIGPEEKQLEAL